MAGILIVEDDLTFSQILEGFLRRHHHEVYTAANVKAGIELLESKGADILLLDYRLPDGTGLEVLGHLTAQDKKIPSVVMTSFQDIRTAVKAIRSGAHDYITKPVNPDELLMIINELLQQSGSNAGDVNKDAPGMVLGDSAVAVEVQQHISLVAPTDMSVIIEGESGTGKEQAARTIHDLSKRAGKPFVAIDCGAIAKDLASSELFGHMKGSFTGALQNKKGQFELADGGTLFLDEVGNLSYEVQVKLLRALQEREIQPVGSDKIVKVNVRVITATNDDLLSSVKKGEFREDLYHRINEFKIKLPALRQRGDDMILFVQHFINQSNKELGKNIDGLSSEVKLLFDKYDWPGNLRELKNVIKRAVLLSRGSLITKDAIPAEMVYEIENAHVINATDLKTIQSETEKELIIKTLEQTRYNKSKAAKLLNIDRATLYYKMTKYEIEK